MRRRARSINDIKVNLIATRSSFSIEDENFVGIITIRSEGSDIEIAIRTEGQTFWPVQVRSATSRTITSEHVNEFPGAWVKAEYRTSE